MPNQLNTELLITAGFEGIEQIRQATNELGDMGETTKKLRTEADRLSREWNNLNPEQQTNGVRNLAQAYNAAQRSNEQLNRTSTQTGKIFNSLKSKTLALGAAMGGIFAVGGIASFFKSAVSGAAGLEEQLSKVKAVSGATADEMKVIEKKAKALGASTRYTATEAAEGFEILARAGLNAQESITAIPSVLALAQGAGIGLGEAAGYITKAVKGMNLSIGESGHVADVLAKAAASANTDVSGLGQALSYAAPSAASLGVSLEETVAIIGKFADAGIDASRAGTALNSIMSQFANPASKFRQELVAIGITTNNFGEALQQMAEKGNLADKAVLAVGQEAGPALKALLAQGMPALKELIEKLKHADGAAKEMAATMDDNLPGALRGLESAWEGLKNDLAQPFLAPLKEKFKSLADSIRQSVNDGSIRNFGKGLLDIATAAGRGAVIIAKYSGLLITLGTAIATARTALALKTKALALYEARATLASKASSKLLSVMGGWVGVGITAAVTATVAAYQALKSNVDEVRAAQEKANDSYFKARENLLELQDAIKNNTKITADQAQIAQDALKQEIDASNERIIAYGKQATAARNRLFVDKKALAAAQEGIRIEEERQAEIEKTIAQTKALITAQQEAEKAQQALNQAHQAEVDGWKLLTKNSSQATTELLKIPQRSQEVITALTQISTQGEATGEALALAFKEGISQAETVEALDKIQALINGAAQAGKISAEQQAQVIDALKNKISELPPRVDSASIALKNLGVDAGKMLNTVSTAAKKSIEDFSTAAAKYGTDMDKMATIYQAALKKMSNPAEIKQLNTAFETVAKQAGLTKEQIAEIAATSKQSAGEAEIAFSKLGVDLSTVTGKISKSTREMFLNFREGMKGAKAEGAKLKEVMQAAFNAMVPKLNTKEEWRALESIIKELGSTSMLTAEQQQQLYAGMEGGKAAADAVAEKQKKAAAAMREGASSADSQTQSLKSNTAALRENTSAAEASAQASEKAEKSEKKAGQTYQLMVPLVYAQARAKIESLQQLGYTAEETAEKIELLNHMIRAGSYSGASFIDYTRAVENSARAIYDASVKMKELEKQSGKLAEKLNSDTANAQDLADAMRFLKINGGGTGNMFKSLVKAADLSPLQKAIDDTKRKMRELTESAKDTADSIAASLAEVRGDTEATEKLQQEQKLRELNLKLQEAQKRGNQEEAEQYQRAIGLQTELYQEQAKQRKKQEEERKQQEAERVKQEEARKRQQAENERKQAEQQRQREAEQARKQREQEAKDKQREAEEARKEREAQQSRQTTTTRDTTSVIRPRVSADDVVNAVDERTKKQIAEAEARGEARALEKIRDAMKRKPI